MEVSTKWIYCIPSMKTERIVRMNTKLKIDGRVKGDGAKGGGLKASGLKVKSL